MKVMHKMRQHSIATNYFLLTASVGDKDLDARARAKATTKH